MTDPDQSLEAAIVAAGANVAPRITPADIEANITGEYYFTAGDGYAGAQSLDLSDSGDWEPPVIEAPEELDLLTFCVLILRNGFTVTGESACASPENFNREIGRRIARQNAIDKVWAFMGYELRTRLAESRTNITHRTAG